ncbi:RNA polymerase beta subunit, chloroplastic [Tanacetum coccineum]
MESVLHISNCVVEGQVKYATCTWLGGALTWWNSHVRNVGHDAAYEIPWKTMMKMMIENNFLRSEIKKLETELWNLTVKGTDVESYTQRFQELVLLCSRMVLDKSDKVERKTNNKRRMDNNSRDNNAQQSSYKRQNVARAYSARPCEKEYAGTLPLCNKCKFHYNGPCTITRANWHHRSECLKLKNQNRGNQVGSGEARGRVYALGGGEANRSPINVEDEADA